MPTTITKLSPLASCARALGRANRPRGRDLRRPALPPLLLMTDQDSPYSLDTPRLLAAVDTLPRGAGIILRHRDPSARARFAAVLAPVCRARGLVLLIASDGPLAARVGAAGVHFPEVRAFDARRWRRRHPRWLITTAAHGGRALRLARVEGADAALLSPVFPTASHPDARSLGPLRFRRLVGACGLPVYALGGVNATTAQALKNSGAVGIAGISGLLPGGISGVAPAGGSELKVTADQK